MKEEIKGYRDISLRDILISAMEHNASMRVVLKNNTSYEGRVLKVGRDFIELRLNRKMFLGDDEPEPQKRIIPMRNISVIA